MLFESLATLCASLFAGAAVYINLVEHPARMSLGAQWALAEWAPSYRRATRMQAPLALVGSVAAILVWVSGGSSLWLAGGSLLGAVIPLTLLVILPTNRALLAPAAADDLQRTQRLLDRWNRLHAVRTVSSLVALVVFVGLLVSR